MKKMYWRKNFRNSIATPVFWFDSKRSLCKKKCTKCVVKYSRDKCVFLKHIHSWSLFTVRDTRLTLQHSTSWVNRNSQNFVLDQHCGWISTVLSNQSFNKKFVIAYFKCLKGSRNFIFALIAGTATSSTKNVFYDVTHKSFSSDPHEVSVRIF